MGDLQSVGSKALQKAPKPLQRALDGINVQFRGENGPTQALANGLQSGNIAGVQERDPNTINVMDQGSFQKAPEQLVTHEGMHLWQNNLPPAIQKAIPQDNPQDPYNFGGDQGVQRVLDSGKGLANMPREQAAAAMQYGQSQGMPPLYQKLANTINDVPLSQIEMTEPNAKTLNTHPRPPQVPTGMNFANTIYIPGQSPDGLVTPDMLPNAMPAAATSAQPLAKSPLQQNIANDQQRLQKVQWAQQNPWGTANNHPGTLGKIAHVLSVAGNIAGDIVAPNVMARIPGTELHNEVEGNQLQGRLNQEQQEESQNEERAANTQEKQIANANAPQEAEDVHNLRGAQAANQQAEADARNNPQDQYEFQQTDHGLLRIDKKTGAAQAVTLNGVPIGPKRQTQVTPLEIGGQEHSALVDKDTGETIKDLGPTGNKPPVVNVNADANRQFQEQERGRGLLDKAEGAYRTAEQGANTMLDMVGMADAGNKMSAQVLPLEGALQITTAQGVHRINRTEVDQYAGAGSLFDKIAGEIGKVGAGQPIPPNIRQDIRKLVAAQEKQAYNTYKGAYDSATKRYHLTDEQPLAAPGGGASSGAGGEAPEGFKVRMPDGSIQVKQGGKWVKQ